MIVVGVLNCADFLMCDGVLVAFLLWPAADIAGVAEIDRASLSFDLLIGTIEEIGPPSYSDVIVGDFFSSGFLCSRCVVAGFGDE